MNLFILAILSCPKTNIQNVSGYSWNEYDANMLKYSEKRCSQLYSDAPCVKLFRKFGKQDYIVICGEKEK